MPASDASAATAESSDMPRTPRQPPDQRHDHRVGKGESGQYFRQEADLNVGFGDHRINVTDEFTVEDGDQRQIGDARGADRPILRRKERPHAALPQSHEERRRQHHQRVIRLNQHEDAAAKPSKRGDPSSGRGATASPLARHAVSASNGRKSAMAMCSRWLKALPGMITRRA